MKTIFAALLGATALVTPVMASDLNGSLKDTSEAAEPFNWGGFYLGAGAGFGVGQAENDVTVYETKDPKKALPFVPSIDELSGAIYGAYAGVNMQRDRIVFGGEVSINGTDISGTSTVPGLLGSLVQTETEIEWYATAVARLGVASGKTLFYGFGGVAWADVSSKSTGTLGLALPGASVTLREDDEMHLGWTAGLGIEHALGKNFVVRVEYSHVDLGEEGSDGVINYAGKATKFSASQDSDLSFDAIKFGAAYKF